MIEKSFEDRIIGNMIEQLSRRPVISSPVMIMVNQISDLFDINNRDHQIETSDNHELVTGVELKPTKHLQQPINKTLAITGSTIADLPLALTGPINGPVIIRHGDTVDVSFVPKYDISLISTYGSVRSIVENILVPLKLAHDTGLIDEIDKFNDINTMLDEFFAHPK